MATDLTVPDSEQKPSPLSAERAIAVLDQLEQELGGREALYTALLAAPPSTDLDYVVGLIADPRNDLRKLSTVCAMGNIRLGEFLQAFRAGLMAPALAKAMRHVAEKTPEIVADVLTRSVVHEVTCTRCQGLRTVGGATPDAPPVPCPLCRGVGVETREPDFERQKFALTTLAQMGPQKGPSVLIDQRDQSKHLSMDTSAAAHGKLLSAVDKLLYGRRELPLRTDPDSSPDPVASDAEIVDTPTQHAVNPSADDHRA